MANKIYWMNVTFQLSGLQQFDAVNLMVADVGDGFIINQHSAMIQFQTLVAPNYPWYYFVNLTSIDGITYNGTAKELNSGNLIDVSCKLYKNLKDNYCLFGTGWKEGQVDYAWWATIDKP